ncbi:MAG: hypothetical protein KKC18_07050 [Chloroflexi bacterium]|nr:hypothetical protein [Chloroflexota bacterium]
MKRLRFITMTAIMVVALFGNVSATYPRQLPQKPGENCEYFSATLHWVCGEFLEFYKTRGGSATFGSPLTKAFNDPSRGLLVQYFQRARMELHPYNPDPYKVLLGLLVDELGYHFSPIGQERIPPSNNAFHHYFPETGHVVSYAFLDHFREAGGLDVFGYPRSEFMYENGYIVQYFQRARMEWHPEDLSGPQMRLTNLGETYIERIEVPDEALRVELESSSRVSQGDVPPPPPPPITKLNASASVRYAITGRQGTQTVFVYVNDQQNQPVKGASVKMIVHYQSGDQQYDFEPTNASGFTKRSFEIQSSPPGQKVVIDVIITYGDFTSTTQTFFLPWL